MNPSLTNFLLAAGSAIGAAGLAWLVTIPLRRRSLAWVLAAVVLTTTAATLGAIVGGAESMLLPMREEWKIAAIAAIAGLLGASAAAAAARTATRDNAALRAAISEVGEGRIPNEDGRRLGAEIGRLRQELSANARVLAESRERERALEASRRELVGWVSHDLRTPLAGLRAMAEALEDGVVEDPAQYYKQIGAAVDRLNRMVDDLFDLSRITSRVSVRSSEPVQLDDLVSDVLASLEPLADSSGVVLTGAVAAPVTVRGDAAELNRAVGNLVTNALRYSPAGGRVAVRVGVVDGQAEVCVEDACGGIPEGDLSRVFDVGFRGEPARSSSATAGGAGLGLAITHGIAQAHGGAVDVANHTDGCRFRLLLPAE